MSAHLTLVLRPSCFSEKSGLQSKRVNKNYISKNRLQYMQIKEPKGVKSEIRQGKSKTGVKWQGTLRRKTNWPTTRP